MTFRGELLRMAREARGLTQAGLEEKSGVSQPTISRLEGVASQPVEDAVIAKLAEALDVPVSFFSRAGQAHVGGACFKYRKRMTTGARVLKQVENFVGMMALRIEGLMNSVDLEPARPLPMLHVGKDDDFKTPEEAAARLRAHWGLAHGPVPNMVESIEAAGGMVVFCDFGTDMIDAMSHWFPPRAPMIFVSNTIPGDRLRLTLAHELGHLVMHHRPSRDEEDEASRFSAEFLLPEEEVRPLLHGLDIVRLHALKLQWGVSMRALVVRAHRIGLLDDNRYKWLLIQLNRRYGAKREPGTIPHERAGLLQKVLRFHMDELHYTQDELLRLLDMTAHEYDNTIGAAAPAPGDRPRLRVI